MTTLTEAESLRELLGIQYELYNALRFERACEVIEALGYKSNHVPLFFHRAEYDGRAHLTIFEAFWYRTWEQRDELYAQTIDVITTFNLLGQVVKVEYLLEGIRYSEDEGDKMYTYVIHGLPNLLSNADLMLRASEVCRISTVHELIHS